MRLFGAVLAAALVLAGCGAGAGATPHGRTGEIRIAATAVPLDPADPKAQRAGGFAYAGGLWLKSPDTTLLGGLSDLKVDPKGDIASESDEGSLLRARLVLDASGRLVGLDHASIEPLLGKDGRPLQDKTEADSEGVALWPDGDLMVSFERDHRIWLYPAAGGPPRDLPRPEVSMPSNKGMEGLTLAPSQGPDAYWVGIEGGSIWLCRLIAPCRRWTGLPAPPFGYRLTALSETPAGDLVILHHSYNPLTGGSGIIASIVAIPARPDAPARVLARLKLAPPMTTDNFEGVAAVKGPKGGLRLYLVSDDNFSGRQRTLLLAFDYAPAPNP